MATTTFASATARYIDGRRVGWLLSTVLALLPFVFSDD
jgi:hypothetical protein